MVTAFTPAGAVDEAAIGQIADHLIGGGVGIHWEAVDEDLSVESLLRLK